MYFYPILLCAEHHGIRELNDDFRLQQCSVKINWPPPPKISRLSKFRLPRKRSRANSKDEGETPVIVLHELVRIVLGQPLLARPVLHSLTHVRVLQVFLQELDAPKARGAEQRNGEGEFIVQ